MTSVDARALADTFAGADPDHGEPPVTAEAKKAKGKGQETYK